MDLVAGHRAQLLKMALISAALLCAFSLLALASAASPLFSRPACAATQDAKAKPPKKSDKQDKQKPKEKAEDSAESEDQAAAPADPDTLDIPLPKDETAAPAEPLAAGVTVTAGAGGTAKPQADAAGSGASEPLKERQDSLSLTADNVTEVLLAPEAGELRVPSATGQPKLPAAKPATPPQAAAQVKPAGKPQPSPATAKPKPPAAKPPAAGKPSQQAAAVKLPSGEQRVDDADNQTLSEYFTAEELAAPDSESLLISGDQPTAEVGEDGLQISPATEVIKTSNPPGGGASHPSLGQVLSGDAEDQRLGAGVAGVSPWRSLAVMLLCLGLLFTGLWAAGRLRSPLAALRQKSLAVIETINIGAGRQIIIVEMHDEALVLGVTPHSINLLDKLPLQEMSGSYSRTVTAIIEREQTALPSEWQQRPTFSKGPQLPAPAPAPPLPNRSYGPNGHGRQSVGEIRRQRAAERLLQPVGAGSTASRVSSLPRHSEAQSKAELISRLREQLSHLEQ